MKNEERTEPEAFLNLTPHKKRGTLKVYVGGAAGVGKTYRMLEEAHRLRAHGHDVVLGLIETHGRAETSARVGDLEMVPLREARYRNVVLTEMHLDAILKRNPEFVVIDELAHTNAPGSRHAKRYQDVEELLANGINVITAFNVQHLESLNPMIKRITGVDVRETVPDGLVARADEVVTVDITVHVETPAESIAKISAADFRALLDNINLAADLGAEIVWLKSSDVVGALLDFAPGEAYNANYSRPDPSHVVEHDTRSFAQSTAYFGSCGFRYRTPAARAGE